MTENDSFASRLFALVALSLIGLGLFLVIKPFIAPLLWAALLALLLFPANVTLRRALGGRKSVAALLLTLAVVLIVVIPAAILGATFFTQAAELTGWLQASATAHHIAQPSDVLAIPAVDRLVTWLSQRVPVTTEQLQAGAVQAGQQVLQTMLGIAGSLFAGALGAAVSVVLSLFLFFFFLRDGQEIVRRGVALVPIEERRKADLVSHLAAVIRGVMLGSLATAIVQGTLVGIAFAIAGLPSPIVFGVLAMFASLVPLVGSTIVWVPATIVLAIYGSWGLVAFMVAWCAGVVSVADHLIRPFFVSSHAKISTLPVFIGLLGGVSAFGPIGLFVGPVIMALVLALLRVAEESRADALVK